MRTCIVLPLEFRRVCIPEVPCLDFHASPHPQSPTSVYRCSHASLCLHIKLPVYPCMLTKVMTLERSSSPRPSKANVTMDHHGSKTSRRTLRSECSEGSTPWPITAAAPRRGLPHEKTARAASRPHDRAACGRGSRRGQALAAKRATPSTRRPGRLRKEPFEEEHTRGGRCQGEATPSQARPPPSWLVPVCHAGRGAA